MVDWPTSTFFVVQFLLPLVLILCKKKSKETTKLKVPPPKKELSKKENEKKETSVASTGPEDVKKVPKKVQEREADDMETVDGCKSNWGAVQDAQAGPTAGPQPVQAHQRLLTSSSFWSSLAPKAHSLGCLESPPTSQPWTDWSQQPPAALMEERPQSQEDLFLPWSESPLPPLRQEFRASTINRAPTLMIRRACNEHNEFYDEIEEYAWTRQLEQSELILSSTESKTITSISTPRSNILVPSCSPATMDSPSRYDEMNRDLSEAHEMNFAMNAPTSFDWCLIDEQNVFDAPYSHDVYAGPSDLNDLDTMFDADITDLDNYLFAPAGPVQPVVPVATVQQPMPEQAPSTSTSSTEEEEEILEEFFPELSDRQRHNSSSTNSSSSVRATPYDVSDYRTRRDKNNEASKRSRAKRAEKFAQAKVEKAHLEKRNIELHTTVAALEAQVADYKKLVLSFCK